MLRVLVLVLLVVLVWVVLSALLKRLRPPGAGGREAGRTSGRGAGGRAAEPLLRCETCGVRVPRSRSLPAPDGGVFCSPACRAAARGPHRPPP